MKKTLRNGLVSLVLGASGLGLVVAGYNYLKDEELILSPSAYVSVPDNQEDNKQNKQTASKQEDYQPKKNSEKTGLKTEQETRKKSGTKPLPEPFEPDEKYLSEEYQRKVREESDEIMRREKDYINSQSNENTNFPVGKDDIEITSTDNPKDGEDIARNLEEYVKKALDNPDARVVEHKKQKDGLELTFEDKSIPKTGNYGSQLYELKRPKYHPSIEDFEKQLEREVGNLVPTYYEFEEGFIGDKIDPLKNKFLKVRENPRVVQNNKHYKEFLKYLEYHYKNPDEKGFFTFENQSVSDLTKNPERSNKYFKENFGFNINFENPNEADKAVFFQFWLAVQKSKRMDRNDKELFHRVLDNINSSGRMPTRNYKSEKEPIVNIEHLNYVNYKNLLEDILGGSPGVITASGYEDSNKDGVVEFSEIVGKYEDDFDLKKNKKLVLGMYLPKRSEKAKTGTIELYNPKGRKVLESNFEIDDELEKGEVNLEELVRKNGFGTYTAAFYVNDKCWHVKQIDVDYDKPVLHLFF